MKKRMFGLSLVALSVLGMVGCNSNTSDNGNSAGADDVSAYVDKEDQDASIVWWNNYKQPKDDEKKSMTEDELRGKYAEYYYATDVISAFEKAHPKFKVSMEYKGNYAAIATAVNAGLGSGDTPNIVSTYQDNVYAWSTTPGALLDMTPYAKQLESDSDFDQSYLSIEKGIYGGKYLSLPYSKSAEMLVVNQDAFDLAGAGKAGSDAGKYVAPEAVASKTKYTIPTTWDDMITLAKKIKTDFPSLFGDNQKNADGFFNALPICYDSGENLAITFLRDAGIDYTVGTAAKAADQVPVFDNAEAKKLFVQVKKWNSEGLIGTQNQLRMDGKYHIYGSELFYTGKSFMNISSTAGASYFAADGYKATVAHVPSYNGKADVISQGPSLAFFDKGEAANDASWKFYKFLAQAENGAKLSSIDSYFPLRKSTYNQDGVKTLTDAAKAGVTASSARTDKVHAYVGTAMNLNTTYSNEKAYYISDVFQYSAKARTAIGKMLESLFNANVTTDADITAKVDELFKAAKAEVFAA